MPDPHIHPPKGGDFYPDTWGPRSAAAGPPRGRAVIPRLLKGEGRPPRRLFMDKPRSHSAAKRETMPSAVHDTKPYANHRAELSHQPTRERELERRCAASNRQARPSASLPYTPWSEICSGSDGI